MIYSNVVFFLAVWFARNSRLIVSPKANTGFMEWKHGSVNLLQDSCLLTLAKRVNGAGLQPLKTNHVFVKRC